MEKQQYIDRAEHALYKVYNRFPVVFENIFLSVYPKQGF